jgi:hypothetical protein
MKPNPINDLARELSRTNPTHAEVVEAIGDDPGNVLKTHWCDMGLADRDLASWIISDVFDWLDCDADGKHDLTEPNSRALLDAIKTNRAEDAGKLLVATMHRAIAGAVHRRIPAARSLRDGLASIGHGIVDHGDAIGDDRRALAREHNRSL